MNVLVVSSDPEILRLLSDMLAADNMAVVGCPSPDQAPELPRPLEAVALVLDGWADRQGFGLVAELRRSGDLVADAPVVFISEWTTDCLGIPAIGARLITRPASLLDVVDQVRTRPMRTAPAPAEGPPVLRPVERMVSARRVARWWSSRATGVIRVDGRSDAWALLAQGGPVGPQGIAAVQQALLGAESTLERCEVDEPGDRAAMAVMLWSVAREAVPGQSVASLVPAPNHRTSDALELPLSVETRRCLERVGGLTIEQLARCVGARSVEIEPEFAALCWLGLIGLRDPHSPEVDIDSDTFSFVGAESPEVGRDGPDGSEDDSSVPTPTHPSPAASSLVLDRIVVDGIAAVSRGDWARADELLTRAHQRASGNAVVAAHLGWARFQNPDLPAEQRSADAAELLELALHIDAQCALAWRYCGEIAIARGDLVEATRCFGLALQILC